MKKNNVRVLLLGSGELGKEIALEFMRLGAWVCAADSYENAPAAQISHAAKVFDMTNPQLLAQAIAETKPTIIVPEIEAIATEVLKFAATQGIEIAASSQAIEICMDREKLRSLASIDLHLPTTNFRFAGSLAEMQEAVAQIGTPCVVKPVMSSSGHGQSVVKSGNPIELIQAWETAQSERRGGSPSSQQTQQSNGGPFQEPNRTIAVSRVIVEAFAPISHELTVLTLSSKAGIECCSPIGQRQEQGDYRESWQPAKVASSTLEQAETISRTIVSGLVQRAASNGEECLGIFGVELFVLTDGSVLFNEVSPRPHDTGLVTLASQDFSEFELHARALLGVPIDAAALRLRRPATVWASRPIVVEGEGSVQFSRVNEALADSSADLRLFGKPEVHGKRRMGVALAGASNVQEAREKTSRIVNTLETILE